MEPFIEFHFKDKLFACQIEVSDSERGVQELLAIVRHFHPSLIFEGKAGAYPNGTLYITQFQG